MKKAAVLPEVGRTWTDQTGNKWLVLAVRGTGASASIELHLTFRADPARHAVLVLGMDEFLQFALAARLRAVPAEVAATA